MKEVYCSNNSDLVFSGLAGVVARSFVGQTCSGGAKDAFDTLFFPVARESCVLRTESPTSTTRPHRALPVELAQFHSANYVEFLHKITPDTQHLFPTKMARCIHLDWHMRFDTEMARYNLGEDCPIFENLFEFRQIYAGATIDAACRLNNQLCDIAINWAGGLHHAKKREASGFCYINDLVLGILELLKYHARVLYIDIDVHHGEGVEEAFFLHRQVRIVSCDGTDVETETGLE